MGKKIIILLILIISSIIYLYNSLDRDIAIYFNNNNFNINEIVIFITRFGDSKYYLIASALMAIIFFKKSKKLYRIGLYIFSSIAISGILTNIIKVAVARYRPPMFIESKLYGFKGFDFGFYVNSFPSGHATTAFAFFISLALLFPRIRVVLIFFATIVAFSRVWLGVHYLSDIIAGATLGGLTSYYLYRYIIKDPS